MQTKSDWDMENLITEHRRLVIRKQFLDLTMHILGVTLLAFVGVLVLGLLLKAEGNWQAAVGILVIVVGIGLVWRQVTDTSNMLRRLEDKMKESKF